MPVCFQLIHDACRCRIEEEFALASIPVVSAKSFRETQEAMQVTYPLATLCIAIDAGYQETLKDLRKKIAQEKRVK